MKNRQIIAREVSAVFVVVVAVLAGTPGRAEIIDDWRFEDGSELSDSSNSVGSGGWSNELDGWTGVSGGKLVRESNGAVGAISYGDMTDVLSGIVTVVLEDIDIVKWNASADKIVMNFNHSDVKAQTACRMQLQGDGRSLSLLGYSTYGENLLVVKKFEGRDISNLSIALEFDIDNKQYRVGWKEGEGDWEFSDTANTWPGGHQARRLRLQFEGYVSSRETADIGRIYVMNEKIH